MYQSSSFIGKVAVVVVLCGGPWRETENEEGENERGKEGAQLCLAEQGRERRGRWRGGGGEGESQAGVASKECVGRAVSGGVWRAQ